MPVLNGIRFKHFSFPMIFRFPLAIRNTVFMLRLHTCVNLNHLCYSQICPCFIFQPLTSHNYDLQAEKLWITRIIFLAILQWNFQLFMVEKSSVGLHFLVNNWYCCRKIVYWEMENSNYFLQTRQNQFTTNREPTTFV